ncbi:MAG: YceI family protein [Bacteroidia bacterium]|nr:YceI family protein [Bacteroidia bacterium]
MKTLTIFTIAVIVILSSGFANKRIWIVDAESRLSIQGSTNVNNFTCKIEYCTGTDTLQYVENSSASELSFTRSRMTIPVRSFDCGTRQISKDFWRTLKSETYPELDINFRSLQHMVFKNNSYTNGVVDIKLAGVTSRYNIRYRVSVRDNNTILLNGFHKVHFSDFNLEAPRKMKGLIKVKEVMNVEFNLVLRMI